VAPQKLQSQSLAQSAQFTNLLPIIHWSNYA
jgi:hypothetical protein